MFVLVLLLIAGYSLSIQIFSQSAIIRILESDPSFSSTLKRNNAFDPTKNDNSITGTPYPNANFTIASIPSFKTSINYRYNAYKDVIEFKDGDELYDLPKDKIYSPLVLSNKSKIVLETSNNNLEYYTELFSLNDITLLKKEKVLLLEGKASNGYKEAEPPKFSNVKTDYYLKTNGTISPFPKNKKNVKSLYTGATIESFLDQNPSFIKNENQLIELTKLIAAESSK